MAVFNLNIKLKPARRAMARSALRLLRDIIPASDAKLYADPQQRVFKPIFPTDNTELEEALNVVTTALDIALGNIP